MSPPGRAPATEAATVLEWLGHATVLVTASDGTRVLFDPYEPMGFDGRIAHAPIRRTVDVVAITHQHRDHCHVTPEMGSPHLVEGPRELGALRFRAVSAFHDREQGARMGLVQLFALEVDGRRIVHLGDIGVPPDAGQVHDPCCRAGHRTLGRGRGGSAHRRSVRPGCSFPIPRGDAQQGDYERRGRSGGGDRQ